MYEKPYFSFFSWTDPPTDGDLRSISDAYQLIYDLIEEEGPFDAIMGFSLGATLACAFLLHHADKYPFDMPFVHFKYAIFIAGSAPRVSDTIDLLPNTYSTVTIPTLHIAGKQDSIYNNGVKDLYEMCGGDSSTLTPDDSSAGRAIFLSHESGHVIPRNKEDVGNIAKAIISLHHQSLFAWRYRDAVCTV